ncbi:DUF4232 domain-containing protein [Streptomyces sp. NPDC005805]|uniref:DUF4232 domain-containing protein n=1 Tax=Streptomyces sp. NPDC005805 TaxID=3157068 RepID=UPI0034035A10
MRIHRIRTAAAVAAAIGALSLTACQGSETGTRDEGKAPAANASATEKNTENTEQTPAPQGTTGDEGAAGGTDSGKSGDTGTTGASGASSHGGAASAGDSGKGKGDPGPTDKACTSKTVKVTYAPVSRPVNHALLTVTNTGSTACNAYYAPLLRIDEGQAAIAIDEGSKPQAVATLAPGESAYAGIMLSSADGSGKHGGTAKKLEVHFAPRSGSGSVGTPAVVKLPSGTYTDSSTRVTYWQMDRDDALSR